MFGFWLRFLWNLFIGVQLAIFQHWFRWWLGAEPMLVCLLTHICVTRPQWSNLLVTLPNVMLCVVTSPEWWGLGKRHACSSVFESFRELCVVLCNICVCMHEDVIKWKPFPRYWPYVRGIHRSPVNFPHKGQWRGALMFSLICAWINGWVNNGKAHRAHYDLIAMVCAPVPVSIQRPSFRV